MAKQEDRYAAYVEHPRFGRGPRFTGLNPCDDDHQFHFHWHSPESCRIPSTAIVADPERQANATVPIHYYFDVERICRDCGCPFIFFAEEQRFWYEELEFGLDSDCVRCVPYRKREQGIARSRQRYEELFHIAERTPEENLEMAECCLALVEARIFHTRQAERVRMLIKRIPDELRQDWQFGWRYERLIYRVNAL